MALEMQTPSSHRRFGTYGFRWSWSAKFFSIRDLSMGETVPPGLRLPALETVDDPIPPPFKYVNFHLDKLCLREDVVRERSESHFPNTSVETCLWTKDSRNPGFPFKKISTAPGKRMKIKNLNLNYVSKISFPKVTRCRKNRVIRENTIQNRTFIQSSAISSAVVWSSHFQIFNKKSDAFVSTTR